MNLDSRKNVEVASAYSLTQDEIGAAIEIAGDKKWRTAQVWHWLYRDLVDCWDGMNNIPAALRKGLSEQLHDLNATARVKEMEVENGGTNKLLLELHDGEIVETVIIPSKERNTVCVSCQVGCAFGCAFCASGLHGIVRSLTCGEIVAQVVRVAQRLGKRPDNVVFMGIGEPFANYDAVLKAARIINDGKGIGIGARKITISTCGVVPGMRRFAEEGIQFELSVSLHAPTQELRSQLMPVSAKWPLDELMEVCRWYTEKTNRIITFEYTLVDGFNNRPEHAKLLVKLLRGLKCRVNLIPLNPVKEFSGETPDMRDSVGFLHLLMDAGVNTTLRHSKGRDVNASCGQLRHRRMT